MARLIHGQEITTAGMEEAAAGLSEASRDIPLGFTLIQPVNLDRFDFLFPALQADPDSLLPEDPSTVQKLIALGATMRDRGRSQPDDPGDSNIPSAYTYFGQFVDHDVTLEARSASLGELLDPNLKPLTARRIQRTLRNVRTATLDLDNLYGGPAPRVLPKMVIGKVSPTGSASAPQARPLGKDDDNDVPRKPRSANPAEDREALIGDPRNDENTIVSQLQLAFLKAHNAIVDLQGVTFEEAQRTLRQHYQHLVVHDYLRRVCDPAIVTDILENGPKAFDPSPLNFHMPLEFAVAAFRFGHTMVRNGYNFNSNFNFRPGGVPATLELLFTFTAFSGQMFDFDTLPENWIIEWENFVDAGGPFDKARRYDTKLVEGLFELVGAQGQPEPGDGARLAVRNLLRGYLLRMPTGQAVAEALGLPALTTAELEAAAADEAQVDALRAGGFLERTPLWFYILAEANHGGGQHLGPVGSTIVADVLIGLVRRSEDSILTRPDWRPTLPSSTPGTFELRDLLALAGVLPGLATQPQPTPLTYIVKAGDTLSSIAQEQLGDANRWPQIFALNRARIVDPDVIFPDQQLSLPDPSSTDPIPQVHRVVAGDTLSGIAAAKLGDANRWPEILNMNRTVINDADRIFPGQVFLLPAS